MQEINDFLKQQETFQLHKTVKNQKYFFPITSYYPNQNIQLDITDVQNVSGAKPNYKCNNSYNSTYRHYLLFEHPYKIFLPFHLISSSII